jgi:hypothetical protein
VTASRLIAGISPTPLDPRLRHVPGHERPSGVKPAYMGRRFRRRPGPGAYLAGRRRARLESKKTLGE